MLKIGHNGRDMGGVSCSDVLCQKVRGLTRLPKMSQRGVLSTAAAPCLHRLRCLLMFALFATLFAPFANLFALFALFVCLQLRLHGLPHVTGSHRVRIPWPRHHNTTAALSCACITTPKPSTNVQPYLLETSRRYVRYVRVHTTALREADRLLQPAGVCRLARRARAPPRRSQK
jgi:hypothetical protein